MGLFTKKSLAPSAAARSKACSRGRSKDSWYAMTVMDVWICRMIM